MTSKHNIRSGNIRVSKMKEEISKHISVLALGYGSSKYSRQIEQGNNFLEMIEQSPYVECVTVSALKKKIKERRDMLIQKMTQLSINMPGHQLSIFEVPQTITFEQQEEIAKEQMWLQQEIDWLHKCLGMCSNRDYFK